MIKTEISVNKASKTNTSINIPKIISEAMDLQHKERLVLEFKKGTIVIKKKESVDNE